MNASSPLDPGLLDDLADAAEASGCTLLDCEFQGSVLRLIIDRTEGVTVDDCQTVSRHASALLDVAAFGSSRYLLEVSSPGLDRKFYSQDDYDKYLGSKVRITWRDPATNSKTTTVGTLEAFDQNGKEVAVKEASTGESLNISLQHVELTRLEPEL